MIRVEESKFISDSRMTPKKTQQERFLITTFD
jgi:hypothetical protein